MTLSKPVIPLCTTSVDADLVRRARQGDRCAQEDLLQRFRRPAYLLALQLLGNPDDAMDVTQDALLRFLKTLKRFDAKRPVKPWLYQIVRNRVHDLRRRNRIRRHEPLDAITPDCPRPEVVDKSADPERDAARAQLRTRLWQALQQLSDHHREILVLRDYRDLSYSEIAAALGIPIGTVMSRLHAARKKLRQELLEEIRSLTHWCEREKTK